MLMLFDHMLTCRSQLYHIFLHSCILEGGIEHIQSVQGIDICPHAHKRTEDIAVVLYLSVGFTSPFGFRTV